MKKTKGRKRKRAAAVACTDLLGHSPDWAMLIPCALMILSSLVIAYGWIVMGNRLAAVEHHPEHPKSLNGPADRTYPSQNQNAPSNNAILLIQPLNRPSHLKMIDDQSTHNLDQGQRGVGNSGLCNRADMIPQLLLTLGPNCALSKSSIKGIMSFCTTITHKHTKWPNVPAQRPPAKDV